MAIRWMLLAIGVLAIIGCENEQYPGAPTISIKKTSVTEGEIPVIYDSGKRGSVKVWNLKYRLEAEEPLPYDIQVQINKTQRYEKVDGSISEDSRVHIQKMQAGRTIQGSRYGLLEGWVDLTLSIVEWDGFGDAPYNVGSSHTLHVSNSGR